MSDVLKTLKEQSEPKLKEFTEKLVPDTKYKILGVRVPVLKTIAKELACDKQSFYSFIDEPHEFYEEYFVHALAIGFIKTNDEEKLKLVSEFIPYIDNWAICDSFAASLKFLKNLPPDIPLSYVNNPSPYVKRLGIVCLMDYFLDTGFEKEFLYVLQKIKSDHYYVNMAIAWYYSVALIKQYDATIPLIESKTLDKFVQNKTISKACDSYRISDEKKTYLKTLRK